VTGATPALGNSTRAADATQLASDNRAFAVSL